LYIVRHPNGRACAQPAVAADRCARDRWVFDTLAVARSRQLNGNPLGDLMLYFSSQALGRYFALSGHHAIRSCIDIPAHVSQQSTRNGATMISDPIAHQILTHWAEELSTKLGRPKEQILQDDLFAGDFPANQELKLTFPDKSTAHFRYAFFVISTPRRQLAVFTEHCGYHVFPAVETVVERITREWFTDE
jgi:hypothetical protein